MAGSGPAASGSAGPAGPERGAPEPEAGRRAATPSTDEAGLAALSAAADGIVAIDDQGTIRMCNRAAEELFSRPADELVGSQFGYPVVGESHTEIDLRLPGGVGRVAEMRVTSTTVQGEHLYIAALRDVTRRRRVERELRSSLQRRDSVIAMVAGELGDPLTEISMLVETLRQPGAGLTGGRAAELVDRIAERTDHLQALVRRFLGVSRIDDMMATPGQVEWVPVLEVVLEQLIAFDREESSQVAVDCSPELVALVDRAEFAEMLTNYLENAFTYGRPPIAVRAVEREGRIEVRVCDSGPGVPDPFVGRLFERFTGEPDSARRGTVTGVSLWIVRILARANGGDAWYESDPEQGACFCLAVPGSASGDSRI